MSLSSVRPIVQNNPNVSETDPVTVFPDDIWKNILPLLNVHDCVRSSWVSRRWKAFMDETGRMQAFFAPLGKLYSNYEYKDKELINKFMNITLCAAKIVDIMRYKKSMRDEEFSEMISQKQILKGIYAHIRLYAMGLSTWEKIDELMCCLN